MIHSDSAVLTAVELEGEGQDAVPPASLRVVVAACAPVFKRMAEEQAARVAIELVHLSGR